MSEQHPTDQSKEKPADAVPPRGISDEILEGDTLDVRDVPQKEKPHREDNKVSRPS